MKSIITKFITVFPVVAIIVIIAYIIEEIIEDMGSEAMSDFVYPIAALIIVGILWVKVWPAVQAYLAEDNSRQQQSLPENKE